MDCKVFRKTFAAQIKTREADQRHDFDEVRKTYLEDKQKASKELKNIEPEEQSSEKLKKTDNEQENGLHE